MEGYACIFDLDGVIVDTAKYHFLAWRKLANALGFDFTEHQNESLKGISRAESLDIILAWGNVELTHAEKEGAKGLKAKIKEVYGWDCNIPQLNEKAQI